jgi:butyryl-CoA dehydrogenase
VVAVEEIARGCGATSVVYLAHVSLCAQHIQMFGTEAQRKRFLPPLARAEAIGAFALTEPGAGSDAAALRTTARKSDGHFVLNGTKLFTTNAVEASTFVVLATRDPALRARGIDAMVVERDTRGLTINPQHGKMGMRASSTAEMVFEDCPVPEENRLGEEGEGFGHTMEVLNSSRIGIGAQCVGIAQAAYEASIEHASRREAFGRHLADFQAIQWMIADMATNIDAARLLVLRAATLRDKGRPYATEASMAKLFASRVAVEATDRAVQVHGGTGYFAPTPVERYFRDARVTEIYEGSSEIQRLIIARNVLGLA